MHSVQIGVYLEDIMVLLKLCGLLDPRIARLEKEVTVGRKNDLPTKVI